MSEPASRRTYPAPRGSEAAPAGELSWTALLGVAPALLRASLLAGQRLLDWTGASVVSITRVIGTGSPSVLLDEAVEPLRRLLGISQIEADLRRLLVDGHVAAGLSPAVEDVPPLPPQPPFPTPPPVSLSEEAGPGADDAESGSADAAVGPGVDDAESGSADAAGGSEPAPSEPDGTPSSSQPGGPDVPELPEAPEMPEVPGLRQRGERLLARSATLEPDGEHPAFGFVLEQVAPDEMRILRLLALDGDQPAIDVEATGRLGGKGRPVATRLSLLAETAGCKHPDRLPLYLDNLERLGLLRVADHPLEDTDYGIIEAQVDTDAARDRASRSAGRSRMTRRRIGLTHFGRSFCETCLP